MRLSRILGPVLLLVSLLAVAGSLTRLRLAFATNGYTPNQRAFFTPLTAGQLPVQFVVQGNEPSIRVDSQGTVYISSIRSLAIGVDVVRWDQLLDGPPNADGTLPFHYLGLATGCGIFSAGCDAIGIAPGGGDSDIAVNLPDPVTGVPNLAVTGLTVAPGVAAAHSTDHGNTFTPQPPNEAAAIIPGDDREWNDAIDTQTVFLHYHDLATFNIEVQRSADGGATYTDGFGEAIDASTFPAAGGVTPVSTSNIATQVHIDKTNCPSRGNLYIFFVAPDNLADNLAGASPNTAYVGVSTDATTASLPFMFTDHVVFTGPSTLNSANIFPALAVDDFGFLYGAWSDNSNIFFTSSSNLGVTWTAPVRVNQAPTVGNSNVFPWLAADADGHVAVAWFGDDRAGNSNNATTLEPCPSGSTTCMQQWANWNLYVAETTDGHDPAPVFTQTVASDHVIHRGTVSTGGTTGSANRNLGDFFQVAMDPQHRINITFADDHDVNPDCATIGSGACGQDDPSSARLIRPYFTRQVSSTASISTNGVCAATGQAPPDKVTGGGQLGQPVNFGLVANSSPLNGALQYQDKNANVKVHSSGGIDSLTISGSCATFTGNAKVNDQPGYRFSVTACDNGTPGAGKDTLSIQASGPNFSYSNSGTLTSGNIVIH